MRHCVNDKVDVFEETGTDLAAVLRNVADEVEKAPVYGFPSLKVDYDCESAEFRATLYVHT